MYEQSLQDHERTANWRFECGGDRAAHTASRTGELQEYYRTILRGLARKKDGTFCPPRSIAITSCYSGEGVTSVAANLAMTAASSAVGKVLLVDANLIRPNVGRFLGLPAAAGLTETVLGTVRLKDAIQDSGIENLAVLLAGSVDGGPSHVFDAAGGLAELVGTATSGFDLVVFDTPATEQNCSALELYRLVDAVVLVLEAERAPWQVAERAKNRLTQAGVNLAGVVMNKKRHYLPNWLYDSL